MWAVALYDLGRSEAEFWRWTPRQFFRLVRRHEEAQRRQDFRAGIIVATMANLHAPRKGNPWQPWEFMPGLPQPVTREQTPEEQAAALLLLAAAFGAKDERTPEQKAALRQLRESKPT
jgi:hypothetical protein